MMLLALSPIISSAQSGWEDATMKQYVLLWKVPAQQLEEDLKKPIQPSGWNIFCHAENSTTAPVSGRCKTTGWGDLPKCASMAQNCLAVGGEQRLNYGGADTIASCLLKAINTDPLDPTGSGGSSANGTFVPLVGEFLELTLMQILAAILTHCMFSRLVWRLY